MLAGPIPTNEKPCPSAAAFSQPRRSRFALGAFSWLALLTMDRYLLGPAWREMMLQNRQIVQHQWRALSRASNPDNNELNVQLNYEVKVLDGDDPNSSGNIEVVVERAR